jgi:arylsulfatase A-like enzyme
MLGQSFERAGWSTFAIHCCITLFDKPHGVVEGIGKVDASAEKIYREKKHNADEVAKRIVAFLRAQAAAPTPFFLWSHMIDPHDPYQQLPGAPVFGKAAIDKYDAELAFVDLQIGAILQALEDTGLADDTIVAITADHGEEFDDHGQRFHGRSVYNESMRVPLAIFDPGAAPNVVDTPVSLVDVAPTLLDLAGIDRPAGQNGRSLAAAVRTGASAPDRTVLGELIADYRITRNLVAAYAGTWKLIWDIDANGYELYSLADDPLDHVDRKGSEPGVFFEMKGKLHDALELEMAVLPDDPKP